MSPTCVATSCDLTAAEMNIPNPSMPLFLRVFSVIIPARYFVAITRGIFLKGVGLEVLWPPTVGLAVYALIAVTLAIKAFKKEIG